VLHGTLQEDDPRIPRQGHNPPHPAHPGRSGRVPPPRRPVPRHRIPPFRRRDLPGIYLALLVFGLVVPMLPAPAPTLPAGAAAPPGVVEPAPPPPPVQVQLVAPAPVVPRVAVLNKLTDSHTVALTFDDGPDPRFTPQVLAILRRHGAVATFCMVADNAVGHEALVKQVLDGGNRLCDHSRTHDEQLPDRTPEKINDEIVGAERTLSTVSGGAPIDWYRAPGGAWSDEITELSAKHGMQPLGWNVDPKDWERPGAAAIVAAVQQQMLQQAPDGAIILLHDGGGAREETVAALEQLIPWLAEHGYRFGFPVP
jgi:peptidoglycan-N-acetylglucosamine deacetylase